MGQAGGLPGGGIARTGLPHLTAPSFLRASWDRGQHLLSTQGPAQEWATRATGAIRGGEGAGASGKWALAPPHLSRGRLNQRLPHPAETGSMTPWRTPQPVCGAAWLPEEEAHGGDQTLRGARTSWGFLTAPWSTGTGTSLTSLLHPSGPPCPFLGRVGPRAQTEQDRRTDKQLGCEACPRVSSVCFLESLERPRPRLSHGVRLSSLRLPATGHHGRGHSGALAACCGREVNPSIRHLGAGYS